MDTDDLSMPAYNGIITEAEKFHHDLDLQFGVLASECNDDDDYLNKAEAMIKEWLVEKNFYAIVDENFFGEAVDLNKFKTTLNKLLSNIEEIRKTPMKRREYEQW